MYAVLIFGEKTGNSQEREKVFHYRLLLKRGGKNGVVKAAGGIRS
jgi:hypothetical protein